MSGRIMDHPIFGKLEGKRVCLFYGEKTIKAYEGDSVAAALWGEGVKVLRFTDKYKSPRGMFCAIGLCTDCIMTVDGAPNVRTCITPVSDGMRIEKPCQE